MHKSHRQWASTFANLLKRHFGKKLVSVVLYGSVATGRETTKSDIDLVIVLEGITSGRFRRRSLLEPVYQEWDRLTADQAVPSLSTIIKTPQEAQRLSPIYFDMIDRRIFLADRNDFFKKILGDVKRRLNRLGAQRKRAGKIEYWDLKPDYMPGEVFEI